MNRRPLGSTEIEVGEVGIGTWELAGDVWGAKADDVSLGALRAGLDNGANLIDTAADYGMGRVEELIGCLLASDGVRREDVVISTKVRPEDGIFSPPPEARIDTSFRPEWIVESCDASLRRLGTDYIDVLFLHTWDRSWGHEDAWFDAMAGLKAAGKIRAIGISVPDEGVGDANVQIARGQVDVIQCVYSVFQQEPEVSLFPLADRFDVGVLARSPFSSGALVQRWEMGMTFPDGDWRATWPKRVKQDWVEEQARMAGLVDGVVASSGIDKPEFCLRYVLASPTVSAVIPGSANPAHVRSNVAVAGAGALDESSRERLKELWRARRIHGTYNGSA